MTARKGDNAPSHPPETSNEIQACTLAGARDRRAGGGGGRARCGGVGGVVAAAVRSAHGRCAACARHGQSPVPRRPLHQPGAGDADQHGGARRLPRAAVLRRRGARATGAAARAGRRQGGAGGSAGAQRPARVLDRPCQHLCGDRRVAPAAGPGVRRAGVAAARRPAALPCAADRAGRPAPYRRRAHLARPLRPSGHGHGAPPGPARLAVLRAAGHRRPSRTLGRAGRADRGDWSGGRSARLAACRSCARPRATTRAATRATAARPCGQAGR